MKGRWMEVIDRLILITGVWTQVVGTVIAAIGETMIIREERLDQEPVGLRLVSIGNGFEADGEFPAGCRCRKIVGWIDRRNLSCDR